MLLLLRMGIGMGIDMDGRIDGWMDGCAEEENRCVAVALWDFSRLGLTYSLLN